MEAARNFPDGPFPSDLLRPQIGERLPEDCPPHGEANETVDIGGGHQPVTHLVLVFATSQDHATDVVPAVTPGGGHNPRVGRALQLTKRPVRCHNSEAGELPATSTVDEASDRKLAGRL